MPSKYTIKQILTTNGNWWKFYEKHKNNLSNNIAKFYKDFGDDELVFDLFCIGLFVSEQRNRNPWDELDVFTSSDKTDELIE